MKKADKKAQNTDQTLDTTQVPETLDVSQESTQAQPEQTTIIRVQAEGKKEKANKKKSKKSSVDTFAQSKASAKGKKGKKQQTVVGFLDEPEKEEETNMPYGPGGELRYETYDSHEVAEEEEDAGKKKKRNKIAFYFGSLMKFYNPITLLPITCLLYVVFFAADIADGAGIPFFEQHKSFMITMVAVIGAALIVWAFITMGKQKVCSLDAFLLIGLLVSLGMLLQCVILKHFSPINDLAIMTLALTGAMLVLMTIRIAIFKVRVQEKANDAVYNASNKLSMYFKVVFTKYAAFIVMLALLGILIIYIVTKSPVLENFEYVASNLEVFVTFAFAAVAVVMMVVSLFIRLVRGRANLVDCMPYIFIIVAIGTLLAYFIFDIYMYLYIAIGCGIVGLLWLILCQYTLKMSIYKRDNRAHVVISKPVYAVEEQEEIAEPQEEPVHIEEPVDEPVEEPIEEPVEEPVEEPIEEPVEEPVEEPIEEPVDEPVVEPVAEVIEEPKDEPVQPVVQTVYVPIDDRDDEEIKERLESIETNLVALMNQNKDDDDDDEDDDEDEEEEDISAIKSVRPRFTYITKLRLASDDIKKFYSELKNELLSYGFRNRISKTKENFNHSRDTKARIVINGKTLKLYLALDPKELDEKYYHHKDMSEKRGVAEIPTLMPVRSKLAVKKAKELIAKIAEASQLEKKPRYKEKDFTEELSPEGMTLAERKGYGYLVRDAFTLEQAEALPDELAEQLADVYTEENKFMRFIKTSVSLDDIVAQFDDGDVVTIDSIREGGIGVQNANYLIIEDGQLVNKKLKVYVDEITPNAVKMIALAGGEVYRIWRKR